MQFEEVQIDAFNRAIVERVCAAVGEDSSILFTMMLDSSSGVMLFCHSIGRSTLHVDEEEPGRYTLATNSETFRFGALRNHVQVNGVLGLNYRMCDVRDGERRLADPSIIAMAREALQAKGWRYAGINFVQVETEWTGKSNADWAAFMDMSALGQFPKTDEFGDA